MHEYATQALLDAEGLEQTLLFGDGQLDVAGDEVGEPAGLGDRVEHLVHDLFGEAALLAELAGALARLLFERFEGGIVVVDRLHLLGRNDYGAEEAFGRGVLERRRALLPLEQELDAAESALDLADAGDDAHGVENVRRRLVGVIALSNGKNEPVALEGGLDRA